MSFSGTIPDEMLAPRTELPKLTDRLPLGTSGLRVSPFCCGMTFDDNVVPAAFEAGINFYFISADMHWPMYESIRKGLVDMLRAHPSRRDEIVVAAVCYVTQPEFCFAPFDEVLEAVPGLGHIDITVAGGSYAPEILTRIEIFKLHKAIEHAGARGIGASFHDRKVARELLDQGFLDIEFVRYNPVHPGAAKEVFPFAKPRPERSTLLFNFKSTESYVDNEEHLKEMGVEEDNWRPHITDYYRFALTAPALDGILVGMPDPDGIQQLADALAKGPLDDEDHQYMLDLGVLEKRRREAEKLRKTRENLAKLGQTT